MADCNPKAWPRSLAGKLAATMAGELANIMAEASACRARKKISQGAEGEMLQSAELTTKAANPLV
jgi:hypothetical protein